MNGRNIWIMARKELSGINYEKTILFAILLQLFVAMFSSFLMVGLTSMYDPSSLSQYSRFRVQHRLRRDELDPPGLPRGIGRLPRLPDGPLPCPRGPKGAEALRRHLRPRHPARFPGPCQDHPLYPAERSAGAIVEVKLKDIFLGSRATSGPRGPRGSPGSPSR